MFFNCARFAAHTHAHTHENVNMSYIITMFWFWTNGFFCRVLEVMEYVVPKVILVVLVPKGIQGFQAPQVLAVQARRGYLALKEIKDFLASQDFLGHLVLQVRDRI